MTNAPPREPHNPGQESRKPKLEWGSGYGGQIDRAQMMAEWEPQQCANIEIKSGSAAAILALDAWRSSTPCCGRLDSHLMGPPRAESFYKNME